MRTVTRRVVAAWQAGKRLTVGNTRTDGVCIWLHGNRIAERRADGSVWVCDGGHASLTTRERLNGIFRSLGVPMYASQRAYALHLTDHSITQPWDGGWRFVK